MSRQIPLTEAGGRVLARDVIAGGDVPPFSRAGMDGYAVRARDTAGASRSHPRTVTRAGVLYTGQVSTRGVGDGECIEISTGAPLPDGADAVVMVEETDADGDVVRIFAEVQPQQNVGRRGADIQTGQIVVSAGETLNSSRIGAVAAVGVPQVDVYERPRVAILSTGNEIVEPGEVLRPGHIYDINRFTLARSFRKTVEFHAPILPLRTRSTRCSRHSTRCWTTTSSSFLEGALSVSAISFAMRSPQRESCYFTA